ncbi:MAG: aminotransferase class V-fold PLP-dependent enzyme [Deltaproteobacteria bacterium]|nr:aminotransferase class V-fold PLP-dependent enzyme [Deltaproteobacteria bacterium]
MTPLYLDANASMPPTARARAAAVAALDLIGNPSSPHVLGRTVRRLLDEAREAVAAALGGQARELVFCSGASEANRWLIDAARLAGRTVWISALEHPSLAKPWALLPEALRAERPEDADMVCCTAAHNETGTIPDLAALLARVRDEAIVCIDAAQACGRVSPVPARADAVVASAHKMGGVAGAGALLLRGRARALPPPWAGGGQEGGLRPGTEPLVAIAAFGSAAAEVEQTRAAHAALSPLRDRLERELVTAWGARALGAEGARLPNTSALVVPDVDGAALRIAVDLAGVCVGFGAACSALAPEPSPALLSLGLTPAEAQATVRLSLPPSACAGDVDEALTRLRPVAAALRAAAKRP